jgi:hypothetical protein
LAEKGAGGFELKSNLRTGVDAMLASYDLGLFVSHVSPVLKHKNLV